VALVSDIEIRLRADIARLQQDMDAARRTVGSAMDRIGSAVNSAKTALGGLAIGMGAVAFANFIKGAIDSADALNDLSVRTRISIEDLSGLAYAAHMSDSSLEGIAGSISKLAMNIGKDGDKFRALGVTATEPIEAFKQLADIFKNIQDPQLRAAFGAEALGKSWQESAVLLNEGAAGIDALIKRGQDLAGVSEDTAEKAGQFNDKLDDLAFMTKGAAKNIAADLLPMLNLLVENLSSSAEGAAKLESDFSPLAETFRALVILGGNVVFTFKAVGTEIGTIAAQLAVSGSAFAQVAEGDFAGAAKTFKSAFGSGGIGDMAAADAVKARKAFDEWQDGWLKVGKATDKAKDEASDPFPDPFGTEAAITRSAEDLAKGFLKSGDAAAKAEAAIAKAAQEAKRQAEAYQGLISTIAEKSAATAREVAGLAALNDAEKMAADIATKVADGKLVLTDAQRENINTMLEAYNVNLKSIESQKAYKEMVASLAADEKKLADERAAAVKSAQDEATANEQAVTTFGMTKAQIEALTLARMEDQLAQRSSLGLTWDEIKQLEALIEAKKRSVGALTKVDELEEAKKAGAEFDKLLDSTKAQDFGDTLAKAFGRAGSAMGQLSTTFQAYAKKQTDFAKAREALEKKHSVGQRDEKAYLSDLTKLEKARFSEQLGGYGDMAGAAAGFFDEQSKGYKVVTAISQAFHAAELAATMAELVPKAISAVLTQGQGDPYTALPRMAAMAAFVAALGVAIGGGGGGGASVSSTRQKANGTGSVLGDSDAKSESLAKALEMVEDNTYRNLAVNYDMLAALRNIESSLSGLGNLIVRTTGISGKLGEDIASSAEKSFNKIFGMGSLGEKLTGGLTGKIIGSIFGGKVTSLDTGLTANAASIASIMGGGLSASQYNDTKKSGGWFSSDKYRTQTTQLGDQVNDQFTKVILSMVEGVKSAGSVLGIAGDDFTSRLNSFVVDIGKISLTGLKGDEIQEALEAAFSKVGDDLASFAVSGLSEFQKVGEGSYETLVRIANNYATVDAVLDSFGKSFGTVGLASVAARESLIDLSGGLEEFTSQGSFFLENFFSDAEKEATLRTAVYARLDKISGGSTVQTVEQFKSLVLAQDLTTQAGREAYASLMSVSQAFIDLSKFTDEAATKAKELAETRRGAEIRIMELSGDAAGALAAQRADELAAMDASIRPLYERIYALEDEEAAQQKALVAAQAAAQLASTRRGLEIQLMQLQGDASGALAAQRKIELDAADASLRPLISRIHVLQDAQKAEEAAAKLLASRQAIELQILDAQGKSVEALALRRKAELAGMDESLRPLYQRLYAIQDEKAAAEAAAAAEEKLKAARDKAVQSALGLLQRSVNAEKDIVTAAYQDAMKDLEGYIDDVNGSIENTKALSQSLKSALSGLSVNSDAARAASQQVGQQQIAMALKVAKATGVLPSANELAAALSAVTSTSMDDYGSYLDYIKATARTASDIGELNGITENQLSIEERQLALLMDEKDAATIRYNGEIERLDKMVTAAQMQIDAINGVDNRVMDVSSALAQFAAAITGSAIPVVTPGVTGAAPWQQTSSTAQQSDTMSGSSVISELQTLNRRIETMERNVVQLADQFDKVTAGGNAMLTE
jgi:hypothetical protein